MNLDRASLRRTFSGASRRELRIAARQVVNRAKILAPVRTGRLRGSIDYRTSSFFSLRPKAHVFSDVEYAPFVNDGTRRHFIRPKNKKVLRFQVGGKVVYARVVDHPGTKPRPFLDRALSAVTRPRGYRIHED